MVVVPFTFNKSAMLWNEVYELSWYKLKDLNQIYTAYLNN